MDRKKLINDIFEVLEKEHINLFHNISKARFEKEKQSFINNSNSLTEAEFEYEMRRLFALFKDSHTVYDGKKAKPLLLNARFNILNNKVFVSGDKQTGKEFFDKVVKINGVKIETIISKLKLIICHETNEWLLYKIANQLSNFNYYILLGIANAKDTTINIETLTEDITLGLDYDKKAIQHNKPYDFKIIDNVLYIRYSQCKEDNEYPFENFVKDIRIQTKNIIKKFILDVRDNTGGNSELLNPLEVYLKSQNMKGAVLINNGTFSSGRFAVARFKKNLQALLIGQPTGGATKSYGYTKSINIDDIYFSASIRYWDFSDTFNYDGAIQPDILVKRRISDIANKADSTLEKALEVLCMGKDN